MANGYNFQPIGTNPKPAVQGPVYPSIYPYTGIPTGSPYPTTDIRTLPTVGRTTRNIALANLLAQLGGPSFEGVYGAQGADELARQYRTGKRTVAQSTEARGLGQSGLASTENRGLLDLYSSGILGNTAHAAQMEDARKRSLLEALLGIGQQDLTTNQSIEGARLATSGAKTNVDLEKLNRIIRTSVDSVKLAAIAVGGGLGAAGALGSAGGAGSALSSGGLAGGIAGAQLGGSIFGSGNYPGGYGTSGTGLRQQSGGGQQPSPLLDMLSNYSPYGPYASGYRYDPSQIESSIIERGRRGY